MPPRSWASRRSFWTFAGIALALRGVAARIALAISPVSVVQILSPRRVIYRRDDDILRLGAWAAVIIGLVVVAVSFAARRPRRVAAPLVLIAVDVGAGAVGLTATRGVPRCTVASTPATVIYSLPTTRRVVALTFDAGADRGYARQILDTLAAQRVSATFTLTGKWARGNADLARRVVDAGFTVVNHTYDHRSFTGLSTKRLALSPSERTFEIRMGESAIRSAAGIGPKPYFRPPYGDLDDCALRQLHADGYTDVFMWSTDSLGWRGASVAEIRRRVVAGLRPGAIYLFHVGRSSRDAQALPDVIRSVRRRGYRFAALGAYFPSPAG